MELLFGFCTADILGSAGAGALVDYIIASFSGAFPQWN